METMFKKMYHFKSSTFSKLLVFIAIATFGFACDDNGYSLDKLELGLATVVKENNASHFVLDNGTTLWPAASNYPYRFENGQRVFLNYTLLSGERDGFDHYIKVNEAYKILTKTPIVLTATNADSIGNDPIRVGDLWIASDYLNIQFFFNYGGIRPHAINLVENSTVTPPSGDDDTVYLEFRHNSYASSSNRLFEGFVSFDLKNLRQANKDSINITLKVKDWGKEEIYKLVYRYNQTEPATEGQATLSVSPVTLANEYN